MTARHGARVGSVVVLAAMLAGCLDAPVPSASPTAAPTPEPTATTTSYTLGTGVWYEGLQLTIDTVTATLDKRGGPVVVRIGLENPGKDDIDLDARILLQVDVDSKDPPIAPTRESKVPTAPAGSSVEAVLTYELQGIESVARGALLIGEAPLHVARVPLTAAGGEAAAFEPVTFGLSGAGTMGDLKIALRQGVLRWDLPDWAQELAATAAVITVTYDVTYLGSFSGGFAFTGDNVALRLPNGTWVGPRRDGHSQSIELIGAGKTKKGLSSRFEVPYGVTGSFALIIRNGTSRAIPFKVPG